jgi:oligopeptide transport system substrate-binding protein
VNDLLARAAAETDAQKRFELYREAEQAIVADAPVIPLYFDTEYDLVRPSVQGLKITPMGIVSLDGVRVQG